MDLNGGLYRILLQTNFQHFWSQVCTWHFCLDEIRFKVSQTKEIDKRQGREDGAWGTILGKKCWYKTNLSEEIISCCTLFFEYKNAIINNKT